MPHTSINSVVLIGRLTRDPELRALPTGAVLCSLRVACTTMRKEPDGSYVEKPNFFNVTVFGARAESVSRYMRKGSRIGVDGRLEWHEWETGEGAKRQAVDIVAHRVEFLDSPPASDGEGAAAGDDLGHDDPGEEAGRELVGVGIGAEEDFAF